MGAFMPRACLYSLRPPSMCVRYHCIRMCTRWPPVRGAHAHACPLACMHGAHLRALFRGWRTCTDAHTQPGHMGAHALHHSIGAPRPPSVQVRHDIKGWELDVSHEFGPGKKPRLELAKTLKAAGGVTLHSSYDLGSSTAGLGVSASGVSVEARAMRAGGSLLKGAWSRPSLHFAVEPLTVLGL